MQGRAQGNRAPPFPSPVALDKFHSSLSLSFFTWRWRQLKQLTFLEYMLWVRHCVSHIICSDLFRKYLQGLPMCKGHHEVS